ncbi:MAG: hypothetical protein FWD62_07455 [Betaproteobacteria bacterium]|nr:hypothetical protein [Betaproteobacteria bacterium]
METQEKRAGCELGVAMSIADITAAVHEQGHASSNIAHNMEKIATMAEENHTAMQETRFLYPMCGATILNLSIATQVAVIKPKIQNGPILGSWRHPGISTLMPLNFALTEGVFHV